MAINFQNKVKKENFTVYYDSAKRSAPRLRWLLIVVLVSLPLLYLGYTILHQHILIKFPGFIAYDKINVRAPLNGYVKSLNIKLGKSVDKGETILVFSSPELSMRLSYLENEKQKLETLLSLTAKTDDSHLTKAIHQAQIDMHKTRDIYYKFQQHKQKGVITEIQLEEARQNWLRSKNAFYTLQNQQTKEREALAHRNEVFYRRRLTEIETEIRDKNNLKNHLVIKASTSAQVIKLDTYESEYVSAGQQLLTLSTDRNLHIVAFVDPKYANELIKGSKVKIYFPDDTKTTGMVAETPTFAERTPEAQVNPIATRSNKIVVIVNFDNATLQRHDIYGVPVKIALS